MNPSQSTGVKEKEAARRSIAAGVEDYRSIVGTKVLDRIRKKADSLRDLRVVHMVSSSRGGGVAQILSSLIPLMNSLGIKSRWHALPLAPELVPVVRKVRDGLQGAEVSLTEEDKSIYRGATWIDGHRTFVGEDEIVVVHDPQPLPMIRHSERKGPWIWRCHLDLSGPHREIWEYLAGFVGTYDVVVSSARDFVGTLNVPQVFMMPAIDPFALQNREMSEDEIDDQLGQYGVPTDLPIVVQVSRFDRRKDPGRVLEVYRLAKREVKCTLVLLGAVTVEDPEAHAIYQSLLRNREDRIVVLSCHDAALVNALQRRGSVVLQMSQREGLGLTVAEAMWKQSPVIGGNAGWIRHQIRDAVNGFVVSNERQAADRAVQLMTQPSLRNRLGHKAKESVRREFLLIHSAERWLDLFSFLKATYRRHPRVGVAGVNRSKWATF